MNIQVFVGVVYIMAASLFLLTYISSNTTVGGERNYVWLGLSVIFFALGIFQFVMNRKNDGSKRK
ncbi:hypothetical protein [Paenibacillus alkalitolerans]|uniref:hypothetical protein n=1 Tax=Paenibacillus alkalitolerans TaxID=2799335 RepID=UPI0018F2C9CE|nr:hypothetical protein [Paenibacillus alkalitolerans]